MCPGFICQGGLRKRYRKGLPWGTCECNMTRSRICTTDDRQRKTLVKRVFPDILLETLISCFVLLHNAQALAFPIRDADLRPPTVRASQRKSCFARHLVPPCAHTHLAAVVKHQESFSFSGSGSVSHPSPRNPMRTVWGGGSLCRFGDFWCRRCSQALPLGWRRRWAQGWW